MIAADRLIGWRLIAPGGDRLRSVLNHILPGASADIGIGETGVRLAAK